MNALGARSKMSSPRVISELTITPLYQYADHEPLSLSVVSAGPRSKKAISRGCAGGGQSKTEKPPPYHPPALTPRPGIGMSEPLWATQFSTFVCGAGSL